MKINDKFVERHFREYKAIEYPPQITQEERDKRVEAFAHALYDAYGEKAGRAVFDAISRRSMAELTAESAKLERQLTTTTAKLESVEKQQAEYLRLFESESLVGARESARHRLIEAFRNERVDMGVINSEGEWDTGSLDQPGGRAWSECADYYSNPHISTFLIQHDWRKALGDSILPMPDDEWKLPAGFCIFEYHVRYQEEIIGRTFFCFNESSTGEVCAEVYLLAHNGDVCLMAWARGATLIDLWQNLLVKAKQINNNKSEAYMLNDLTFIRAACIALDAQGAEAETVSVPPRLARARAARRKPPMFDYKIIQLAKRFRKQTRGEPTGRHVRLHLRRGHWWPRRGNDTSKFAEHRHWRRWRFVGDPDLGFIEHEYPI